jgi:hypothetical protein
MNSGMDQRGQAPNIRGEHRQAGLARVLFDAAAEAGRPSPSVGKGALPATGAARTGVHTIRIPFLPGLETKITISSGDRAAEHSTPPPAAKV